MPKRATEELEEAIENYKKQKMSDETFSMIDSSQAGSIPRWKKRKIASLLYKAAMSAGNKEDLEATRQEIMAHINRMDYTLPKSSNKFYGSGLYSGRGGYNLLKSSGSFTRGLGNLALGAATKYLGGGLYSGRGSYSTNALIDGGRPTVSMSGSGDETQSIMITHTEYLQDVFGAPTANFYVDSWAINPGLSENFPWLAQIAANYEEYELHQLVFHYKSTVDASAINNTNGSTGTLIMATNYNPTAPPFANKETMMQYHGANSCRVVDDCSHGVECDPEKNAGTAQKYIRANPVVVGQDPKTFDLGLFQLAQANLPTAFQNQQIGELWVTYSVILTKPRLYAAVGSTIPENRYILSTDTQFQNLAASTALLSMQQNVLLGQLTTVSHGFKFTFPDFCTGRFEIQVYMETTSLGVSPGATIAVTGNCTRVTDMFGYQGTGDNPANGVDIGIQNGATGTSVVGQIVWIGHVDVQPVTAGVDNTFSISWPTASTATINQAYIVVRLINASSSQSATNPIPVYVNNAGIVTAPY